MSLEGNSMFGKRSDVAYSMALLTTSFLQMLISTFLTTHPSNVGDQFAFEQAAGWMA